MDEYTLAIDETTSVAIFYDNTDQEQASDLFVNEHLNATEEFNNVVDAWARAAMARNGFGGF